MQPYPAHLVQVVTLGDGRQVTIRPIRPEDAEREQAFVRGLSDESRYYRFMDSVRELSPGMLAHFTSVDYVRHMALVAVTADGETQVAVARYVAEAHPRRCEFAIVVADAWQGRGLGTLLMRALMQAARGAGIAEMYGEVLASNHGMLALAGKLGFSVRMDAQDPRMARVEARL